jgi:hypothetical protein
MTTTRYRQNPRAAGRIIDGHAFVVTPNDNKLHTLNPAGTEVWTCAKDGCTADEAAAALTRRFEVDDARARADAEAFLADLVARGVLVAG